MEILAWMDVKAEVSLWGKQMFLEKEMVDNSYLLGPL
jgi:hypothetical protein